MYYEYVAVAILLLLLIYFGTAKKIRDIDNTLFLSIVVCNLITAVSDIASKHIIAPRIWVEVFDMLYYVSHLLIVPLLFFYVMNNVRNLFELSKRFLIGICSPVFVTLLIVLSNPITHLLNYYDENNNYVRCLPGYLALYITAAFYIGCLIYVLIYYREFFSTLRRVILFLMLTIIVGSVILQFLYRDLRIETFAITYAMLTVFFFIQNPYDQLDQETNLYNKVAFDGMMGQLIAMKKRLVLVGVILSDFDDVAKTVDEDNDNSLSEQIGSFLKDINHKYRVYRYDRNLFCIEISNPSDSEAEDVLKAISDRFKQPWHFRDYDILYKTKLLKIDLPDDIRNLQELDNILMGSSSNVQDKQILSIEDFDLMNLERRIRIAYSLLKALDDMKLELVFTPVCRVKDKKIFAIEIGTRFLDSELGYVYESEIISYIERSGQIKKYTSLLFDKVCEFVSEFTAKNLGVEYLFIRIPSIMCIQSGMVEDITKKIISKGIDPKTICFEISEFMVLRTEDTLKTLMPKLAEKGFRFCLEDYGSGFTNLASVYELPFNVLMVSSHVVAGVFENEKAAITFRKTIELAGKLDMKTMIGGVDSIDYFNLINTTDCNYAKGSYFLDNVGKEELIEILGVQKNDSNMDEEGGIA